MKTPKNGQIVLFSPPKCSCGIVDYGQMMAAIVTHVWNDRLVTLTVFDAEGNPWSQRNVQLLQDDDKPGTGSYCFFPDEDQPEVDDECEEGELVV